MNFDQNEIPDKPLDQAIMLKNMVTAVGRNGKKRMSQAIYVQLRANFLKGETRTVLPTIISTCGNSDELWAHLAGMDTYAQRDKYIADSFHPLLELLELKSTDTPGDLISETLSTSSPDHIQEQWEKAVGRRFDDPDGAITAARTLLESTCKTILDESKQSYGNDDLPKLYGKVAKLLNLAPSQHTEKSFKAILGGCHTIIENLGTLRNKIGDAHGQGLKPIKPDFRHATLTVHLAGAMSTFLLETWRKRKTD